MSSFEFLYDGEPVASQCEKDGDGYKVTVGESEFRFVLLGDNLYSTQVDGRRCVVGAVGHDGTFRIEIDSPLPGGVDGNWTVRPPYPWGARRPSRGGVG